jgi:hypothetical protein
MTETCAVLPLAVAADAAATVDLVAGADIEVGAGAAAAFFTSATTLTRAMAEFVVPGVGGAVAATGNGDAGSTVMGCRSTAVAPLIGELL